MQIYRSCREKRKHLLFLSWNRLRLHASCAVSTAVAVTKAERIERASGGEASRDDTDVRADAMGSSYGKDGLRDQGRTTSLRERARHLIRLV